MDFLDFPQFFNFSQILALTKSGVQNVKLQHKKPDIIMDIAHMHPNP